jgi:hypothetical protein
MIFLRPEAENDCPPFVPSKMIWAMVAAVHAGVFADDPDLLTTRS